MVWAKIKGFPWWPALVLKYLLSVYIYVHLYINTQI